MLVLKKLPIFAHLAASVSSAFLFFTLAVSAPPLLFLFSILQERGAGLQTLKCYVRLRLPRAASGDGPGTAVTAYTEYPLSAMNEHRPKVNT